MDKSKITDHSFEGIPLPQTIPFFSQPPPFCQSVSMTVHSSSTMPKLSSHSNVESYNHCGSISNYPFPPPVPGICPPTYSVPPPIPFMFFPAPTLPPVGLNTSSFPVGGLNKFSITANTSLKLKEEEDSEFRSLQRSFFGDSKKPDTIVKSHLQLSKVNRELQNYYKLLNNLESLIDNLKVCPEDDEETWKKLSSEAQITKDKIMKQKELLNLTSESLKTLKMKVKLRKKKRTLQKKRRLFNKSIPSKHEIANQHMQYLIQEAERLEQEGKLKKEADNILSSVRQKKNEARNQINLLAALQKLHSARVTALSNEKNNLLCDPAVNGFKTVIEKLTLFWQTKLSEYEIEERGLKIMIDGLSVSAEDEECNKLKKVFGKWLKFLFGTTDLQYQLPYSNYEEFVLIRQNWDKFVVAKSSSSSKIPGGWIVPKYNCDESWRKFVQ